MICYASRTGTRRNLAALKAHGWRLIISRVGEWRTEGFAYAIDNGAWSDFQRGQAFDDEAFERMIDKLGANADWIVLPDIVAGGLQSLELSLRWSNRCLAVCGLVLIAVQDGMEPHDVKPYVGPTVGIFLGGSTEWKLGRMLDWGRFCATTDCYYHVARVNTQRRFRLAISAGADSFDGSSASRFSKNVPRLTAWASAERQLDFYGPP